MTSCSEQGASFLIESFANDLDTALKEKKEMLSHLFSSLLILSAVAFCDSSQPPDDDQLAFAPALAQAPVIEPNDDACFAKVAAAYEAYKNNGLRGNEDSLIPHLYKEYLNGTLPGLFCYQVDVEDVAESIVVGTYLGGIPGENQLAAENKTQEELEDANGAWPGYISDENLCCGPEKSFYYCSPILGKSRNITACSQEPQYTSKDATTLATRFSDGTGEDRAIFCGCVMDQDTTEAITLKNNLDPVEIEKVIQQYSTSGTLLFSGTLTVLVASAMATLL